ncbi:MAG: ROK family protein [candidate division Zixibacteria bacterium]|nr:ROK family protein [candidate division Zixibacteria bacterium]
MITENQPNPAGEILGVDIGGSGIKAAPVDIRNGTLKAEPRYIKITAETSPKEVKKHLEDIVQQFNQPKAIGVGYPGVVKNGTALSAANVSSGWLNLDIEKFLQPLTEGKLRVINDADAAGLAEMRFGSGRGHNRPDGGTVLLLTLGTGIGSAFFHQGRLFPNTEFGHVYLDNGLEGESFAAASVRVKQNLSWESWCERLNYYLKEMEKLTSPDLIIIGGGIIENFDKFKSRLKTVAPVKPAQLGNDAGIIGAALYASM